MKQLKNHAWERTRMKILRRQSSRAGVSRSITVLAVAVIIIVAAVIGLFVFNGNSKILLNGAGATFPYPLYSKMISNYTTQHPGVQINYQSIGSGAGIKDLINMSVDFAASDAPLTDSQRTQAPNSLHIPMTIGSITLSYNLPGIPKGLNLTGTVIAEIYLGNITKWNDPSIQNLNLGFPLPNKSIFVVHRSDGSGTTFVFTSYLNLVSSQWSTIVGRGTAVSWPVGVGQSGNAGVAQYVQTTPYAIGYVELAYALQNGFTYAFIQNPSGQFVEPTLTSVQLAAVSKAGSLPMGNQSWYQVNVLLAPASGSYPIASFSYILVYKELNVVPRMTIAKATALVQFLWWAIHTGQSLASSVSYVPLPAGVVGIDETTIKAITFNSNSLQTAGPPPLFDARSIPSTRSKPA